MKQIDIMEKFQFARSNAKYIFIWPIICLIIGSALWAFVGWRQSSEKAALESRALVDAASLSRAYASYISRTFEQMDQITMHVKADWEQSDGKLKLEDLKRNGLFAASQFVAVAVIDSKGHTITSTVPYSS
ncbi:MAG: signal transduction protein, partial [Burkholderiaceae bacterium]